MPTSNPQCPGSNAGALFFMETIKQVLMRRDGMSASEANELIREAKAQLREYLEAGDTESAHYICEEFFGLEPDYLFELL